jgi:acyl-CoA synthetase (AMP-forming)/AMP-acid ligase II/acyl carrier protein
MKDDMTTAPVSTVGELIADLAVRHGDLPALQDLERAPLTFAEMADRLRNIRHLVAAAGIAQDDCVGVWVRNRADAAIWLTALGETCACLPLVSSMTSDAVLQAFEGLGIKALITDGSDTETCGAAVKAFGTPRLFLDRGPNDWSWTLSGQVGASCLPHTQGRPEAIAFYLMTSGSTGSPKIVPVRHQAITLTAWRAARDLEVGRGETTLNVMQLNHVRGLVSGVFMPWMGAASTIMPGDYSAQAFLDWYWISKPTWFSVSPAIYGDLLRRAQASSTQLQHKGLRFVRCGSAALNDTLRGQIERGFGVPLLEAYGMSEALQICGTPFSDPRAGTVGRSVADDLAIFDDNGRVGTPGTTGEICIKGRTVMSHYVCGPDQGDAFRDGWFRTGDIGHLDSDGYLTVTGRLSGRINLGGEMVAPTEIENALMRIEGVSACICFGTADENNVEILCAAVALADDRTPDATDLRQAARLVLPMGKIPARFYFVDDIPRDANGKENRASIAQALTSNPAARPVPANSPAQGDSIEDWLAACFCRALRLDRVTPQTDFFETGGTSLDATELVLEIETTLGEPVHLPILFEASTIERLTAFLKREYPSATALFPETTDKSPAAVQPPASGKSGQRFNAAFPVYSGGAEAVSAANPVFILSAPRCGSTLLRVMLAGHPDLFSPPEMRLLMHRTVDEWAARNDGRFRFFRDGLVQALMSSRGLNEARARDWLDDAAGRSMPVGHVFDFIQGGVGQRRIIDKSPTYALDLNLLKSIPDRFEAPKFVVLYRNPHDMKRSYVASRMDQVWMYGGPSDAGDLAEMIWNESYSNIEAFETFVDRRQVHHIHFEQLVQDPQDVMKRLSGFLGVQYDPKTVAPYGEDENRMVDGLNSAAKMIGDPRFKQRASID